MMSLSSQKTSRIENRCTAEQKHRLQLAAELTGVSTNSFTLTASLEKADKVINAYATLKLTLSDQDTFVKAILTPPEPTEALFKAKNKFHDEVKNK